MLLSLVGSEQKINLKNELSDLHINPIAFAICCELPKSSFNGMSFSKDRSILKQANVARMKNGGLCCSLK